MSPSTASAARPRVLLLFGGRSSEHEISCVSARCVLEVLDPARWDVVPVGIDRTGRWVHLPAGPAVLGGEDGLPSVERAAAADPGATEIAPVAPAGSADSGPLAGVDVVFPVLHGAYGEDGAVQGLLEMAGLRYVGSGVLASAASMDKIVMKTLLAAAGNAVGPWVGVTAAQWRDDPGTVRAACADLALPLFVKPARGGSSLGITKVAGPGDLSAAIEHALEFDVRVIVEQGLPGREIECGVLATADGRVAASVPGEIVVTGRDFYDFEAKYLDEAAVTLSVPADLPASVVDRLRADAVEAFAALGCEGLARVDFFVAGDRIFVNEVNTMPGFTPVSMYPRMWQATGLAYAELVDALLEEALARPATALR